MPHPSALIALHDPGKRCSSCQPSCHNARGGSSGRHTVRLIAYGGHKAWIATLHLDADFDGVISGGKLNKAIGSQVPVVAAIVTYHDSTGQVQQYAPYTLTVNGVLQPGG